MTFFYTLAVALSNVKEFFLANFIILGTLIGLGFGLWPILKKENRDIVRKITMLLVGGYIFFAFGIGLIYPFFRSLRTENMQIEGFWFYLVFVGFAGTVYHYTIAKIVGPFLFGRTFCGWACWTAAILDFLPWRNSKGRINKRWEYFRYVHFFLGIAIVLILLFVFNYSGIEPSRVKTNGFPDVETIFNKYITLKEFWWFLIGNCLYYFIAIILSFALKDNRAFCKYVCPITVFMKIGSRFSLLKIKTDKDNCEQCGRCEEQCMMDIKICDYAKEGKRISSSECIVCLDCARVCPNNNLRLSFALDAGFRDKINRNQT
jgi:polyferredoxin